MLLLLACASFTFAAQIESPFNQRPLNLGEKEQAYSFLVGGHLYGAHGASVFPASSLLANIEFINTSGAKFFVSLGDIIRDTDSLHIANFQNAFAAKLNMPLFNAVGNHDQNRRQLYETQFGQTYFHFAFNREFFIFLDTELNTGNIAGDQLDSLRQAMRTAIANADIHNVFIFSHRLLWCVGNPDYQIVAAHVNEPFPKNNYKDEIEPILFDLANHKRVYWISGDVGTYWSLPLFYQKVPNHHLTYIAAGIGDTGQDAILQVNVSQSDDVGFAAISLAGQKVYPVEHYGPAYWQNHFGSKPSVLQNTYGKFRRMLVHSYFWTGFLVAIPVGVLFILLSKRSANK